MHRSTAEHARHGRAVNSLEADHNQTSLAWFGHRPGPVIVTADARPDALHDQPHWLAAHRRETLDPQYAGCSGGGGHEGRQGRRVVDFRERNDEAVELV